MNTLFRVTHSSNFNTSVQALMLIHQLLSSHQGSNDRFYRTLYESLLDPRLYHSSKQALYLNLLFKALKSDLRINRVKAFSKRLLQVINMHQPPFVCGALYLLRELESVFASLSTFVDDPQVIDSDEEEIFQDVHEDTDVAQSLHAEAKERHDDLKLERSRVCHAYDGRKRDPQHSNADKSSLWELVCYAEICAKCIQLTKTQTLCLKHFHPTVTLFASKLMHHETLPAKPDLSLHTLIHFLDRFVYKNPKSSRGTRGASIMQPMNCGNHSSLLLSAHARTQSSESVNSEAFWKQESEMVEADEIFFHKYFSTMGRGKEKARKKKANRLSGVDSGSEEDEDEDEIWKALVDSRPELEGSSSSDDDRAMNQMDLLEDSDDNIRDLQNEDNKVANANQDMIELEDGDEALLASDEEVPSDLDQAIDPKFHDVGEDAAAASEKGKRKKKRRKLRTLPVFASADDYAAILNYDG